MGYLVLTVAIAAEVGATVALRMSNGFSRPLPAVLALAGYGVALWLLALAMRTVPLSVSYPMWAGVGTAGALLAAWAVFGERLLVPQWAGVALVLLGVVLLNPPRVAGAGA
ncbi:MAG TPA: multidrug efflux SMR transporter [Geodermatophilus sp.]|nr:multidrug efflux SMR transporter [Geodermatophilus sp.]